MTASLAHPPPPPPSVTLATASATHGERDSEFITKVTVFDLENKLVVYSGAFGRALGRLLVSGGGYLFWKMVGWCVDVVIFFGVCLFVPLSCPC